LRLVQRAGTWEQVVGEPQELVELPTRSLPDDISPGSAEEREALLGILNEQIGEQDLSSGPLAARYVRGVPGGSCYLALSLHGIAADVASRETLVADIFTAFGQRLAGQEISLEAITTSWTEWSQRCAALAVHPAVVESRDFWLETARTASLPVANREITEAPDVADLMRLPAELTISETTEIDDARRRLRVPIEEMLLAALSRTIAATVGDGPVAVDLAGPGRSVLKPDVDLRRTVGSFTTVYPVALDCGKGDGVSAKQLLQDAHDKLNAVPHYGIGYGLLRYLYAPTARLLGATAPADIFFNYVGAIPDLPALGDEVAVQFHSDTALPVREAVPGLGHAIEFRVYRSAGVLHLDWWYDARKIDAATVQSLADGFSRTLLGLIADALAEDESDADSDEMELVDLS
jgi:phthiocerol/phenolphthiocerol synthesis type-I polyketide synthase E